MSSPSDNIKTILEANTSLVFETDLFVGREPTEPDNTVTIFDTPGEGPLLYYSQTDPDGNDNKYDYDAFQIRVRNNRYDAGYDQIREVKEVLHGRGNEIVGIDEVKLIEALDSISLLDWDENNRARFVINFAMQRIPGTET